MVAHREHIRVEWVDTDASGRIHNTVPLRFAERAEHAFLRSAGLSALPGLLRRRIEVEYLGELVFGDELVLDFRVERIGTSSLTDRKSTRLNSRHVAIWYARFSVKKQEK